MSIKKLKSRRLITAGTFILLVLWLGLVNPHTSQPFLLLIPFVLIFILIQTFIYWFGCQFGSKGVNNRLLAISWFVGLILDVAIVLCSLRELSLWDGLAMAGIGSLGVFYIVRLMPTREFD